MCPLGTYRARMVDSGRYGSIWYLPAGTRAAERRSKRFFRGFRYYKTLQLVAVASRYRGEPGVNLSILNKRRTISRSRAPASRSMQAADLLSPRARPRRVHRAIPAMCPEPAPHSSRTAAAARRRSGHGACGWRGACRRRSCCGIFGRARPGCPRNCWPGCGRDGRWRG